MCFSDQIVFEISILMDKEINGKRYEIKEITYLQGVEVEEVKEKGGLVDAARILMKHSVGLTDEQINSLSMKEGLELQKVINEVNGADFQTPVEED